MVRVMKIVDGCISEHMKDMLVFRKQMLGTVSLVKLS